MKIPRALPEFEGWTVDEHLQEFRKVSFKEGVPRMITLKFSSRKGAQLLHAYMVWRGRGLARDVMRRGF